MSEDFETPDRFEKRESRVLSPEPSFYDKRLRAGVTIDSLNRLGHELDALWEETVKAHLCIGLDVTRCPVFEGSGSVCERARPLTRNDAIQIPNVPGPSESCPDLIRDALRQKLGLS